MREGHTGGRGGGGMCQRKKQKRICAEKLDLWKTEILNVKIQLHIEREIPVFVNRLMDGFSPSLVLV